MHALKRKFSKQGLVKRGVFHQFANLLSAWRFVQNAVIPLGVIEGTNDKYWVLVVSDCVRMEKRGYKWITRIELGQRAARVQHAQLLANRARSKRKSKPRFIPAPTDIATDWR